MLTVSCIMPVYGRRELLSLAIGSFLSQNWPAKELIVVDDSPVSLVDLFRDLPNTIYVRRDERLTIGAKRNLACEYASGEFIVHQDSDDWSAPGNITDQVTRMLDSDKSVCGYHTVLFYSEALRQASKYSGNLNYAWGASLCYTREFWKSHPFPTQNLGEDNAFVAQAQAEDQIICVDGRNLIVQRLHGGNTSKNDPFPVVPVSEIPEAFFKALEASKL